jgi:hypothetical protein
MYKGQSIQHKVTNGELLVTNEELLIVAGCLAMESKEE